MDRENHNMKKLGHFALALACFGLAILPELAPAQVLPGIPEPGLILYGAVTNATGNVPLLQGAVRWSVTGGGSSVTVDATVVNVNGQYSYVARVPFETRNVSGLTLTATPNTLPLSATATTFTRTATVNGTDATIAAPKTGSFQFGPADRGLIERADLTVTLPVTNGTQDTDGDGVPDFAEIIAGTNPNDAKSVLKLSTDIQPLLHGGLIIRWSSVPGKSYIVSRTSSLGQSFSSTSPAIPSAGTTTTFSDTTALGNGPFFYRIQIAP